MNTIRLLLLFVSALTLAGCANNPPAATPAIPLPVTPGVGLGPVKFGMTKAEVIKHLGQPEKEEGRGTSLGYPSQGFAIGVHPRLGVYMFAFFTRGTTRPFTRPRVNDFAGKTPEGIGMGSSEAQIVAAYGKPDTREVKGRQTDLSYNRFRLHYILLSDRLVQFTMMAPERGSAKP